MIIYPHLEDGATIGVTAPSSGLRPELHELMHSAVSRMRGNGFQVTCGDTVWTQNKAKSASGKIRVEEWNAMIRDEHIDAIIPPWGGELLIEILEHLSFDDMPNKWVLGYSDLSVLLLAITLKTGIATAHGANFIDLRGEYSDATTAMWRTVLAARPGESVQQQSSLHFQREWKHDAPSPCVFHLEEPTYWKTVSQAEVNMQGRLLGGCIDVIRHLIGTPYGNVQYFQKKMIRNEPILWYLENCELNTADLHRSLVQMKLAGWFEHCAGLMFGRSPANQAIDGYTVEYMYQELSDELQIPLIYDMDCGHVPPQITLINGSHAEVHSCGGKGTITQYFRP